MVGGLGRDVAAKGKRKEKEKKARSVWLLFPWGGIEDVV